jgi:hypothetical protein
MESEIREDLAMRVLAIGSAASAFLTFMLFGAASVQANVIYDNGGMDLADLFFSDSGFGFQRFDDFNISGSGTVVLGDVHWWGAYSAFPDTSMDPADPDDFTIQIWSDSGGSPNALVYDLSFGPVDRVATGLSVGGTERGALLLPGLGDRRDPHSPRSIGWTVESDRPRYRGIAMAWLSFAGCSAG